MTLPLSQILHASWDETGRPGQPKAPMPPVVVPGGGKKKPPAKLTDVLMAKAGPHVLPPEHAPPANPDFRYLPTFPIPTPWDDINPYGRPIPQSAYAPNFVQGPPAWGRSGWNWGQGGRTRWFPPVGLQNWRPAPAIPIPPYPPVTGNEVHFA